MAIAAHRSTTSGIIAGPTCLPGRPGTLTRPNDCSPLLASNPVVVTVANAKGGVGKTSIVANLSALGAAKGHRVLAIDLDPQGNLSTDLGCKSRSDSGRSLGHLLRGSGPVRPIRDVRQNLDIWPGGPELATVVPGALIPIVENPLATAIAATGTTYDVVFVDCPPTLGPTIDAGLAVADQLIVPIRADHASLDGLGLIGDRVRAISERNSSLTLMGVVLFDVSRTATALVQDVADALKSELAGLDPRPLPAIRRSERSAFEMRKAGKLAHEYALNAPANSTAANLAQDYAALGEHVYERIEAARRAR